MKTFSEFGQSIGGINDAILGENDTVTINRAQYQSIQSDANSSLKSMIAEALYVISLANENQAASPEQTKVAIMLSELGRRTETDGQYPQPVTYPLERT